MCSSTDYRELVEKSQQGDDESLNRLAEAARLRLHTYVFRLTMREELTQDVVQESLLEMFKFLDKLESADRFWPWIRRIALNKVRHHYSREKQRRTMSLSESGMEEVDATVPDGLANLVTTELREIVTETMSHLKGRYREVLVMRCYEEMDYGEIGQELGCSEFSARVLFFRAKKSLAKQLSRRGLGKGALLTALVIFGKITASSEAAAAEVTVTAAAMHVGTAAVLVGTAGSKAVLVSLAAASVVTVGSVVMGPPQETSPPSASGVRIEAGAETGAGSQPSMFAAARNVQQCWYFFPDGGGRSVMMRQLMPDPASRQSYCLWLQNHVGNYYYDADRRTVHVNNYRMWSKSLAVTRLPSDGAELTAFLDEMEGRKVRMEGVSQVDRGALVIVTPEGREDRSSTQVFRHPSLLYEEYFQYGWPADIRMVDGRDEMHRRGWTWFSVSGDIAGRKVAGAGRLPFVYGSSEANPSWMSLQLDGRLLVCDGPEGTYAYDSATGVLTTYAEGSFLSGLARPWMGLHAVDTIRRDAAEQRICFETRYTQGRDKAEVTLLFANGKAVYTIDMRADVIESIALVFRDRGGAEQRGILNFTYTDTIDDVKDELIAPRASRYVSARGFDGPLWLLKFAEGTLSR
ncbi:MAG: RNA polymerase sigma factor [Phycisphaerae bacterium]|nr:RNA polymerase sigma factor [Phycisphaerae bacterium]